MQQVNGVLKGSGTEAATSVPGGGNTESLVKAQGQNTRPPRFVFRKAVKYDAKLRLALSGPGGSGKTYTALKIASGLGGKIAVVDTEHGSASKYADEFDFDVIELGSFDPACFPVLIADVAAAGYSTLITDSWSHFWMGTDGELDQVDKIAAKSQSKNSFAAWRHVSPKHTRMVDAMLSAPIHIIVTMRVKTEWVMEKNERTGKTEPRKVGLNPVMKEGTEYEFDVCGEMDQENTMVVTKSRCKKLNSGVFQQPGLEVADILREWLASPEQRPPAAEPEPEPEPKPTPKPMTPAEAVAERKIANNGQPEFPWRNIAEMKKDHNRLVTSVGLPFYLDSLARYGYDSQARLTAAIANDHPHARDHALAIFQHMEVVAGYLGSRKSEVA